MRKQYQIENLDCAHCAMKMEEAAKKIEGVVFVNVNFLSKKLTLEAEDRHFAAVYKKVEKAVKKIEPDVKLLSEKHRLSRVQVGDAVEIGVAVLLFLTAKLLEGQSLPFPTLLLFLPAYLVAGFRVLRRAILGIFHGTIFDENFLMTIATFGAFAIGEGSEGVMVMVLYRFGEFFQELAVSRSRKSIASLLDIRPDHATVLDGEEEILKKPEEVPVGSLVLVKPGEKIPLDGVVVEGESFLDTTALTGESVPREAGIGTQVLGGCINMSGLLKIRTEKEFSESSVTRILSLIENATDGKSEAERLITRFARYYTPVVVVLALVLALVPPLFGGNFVLWLKKAITCLVISCPCALVISVPLSFFGGIGCAGRNGVLIKSAGTLEALAKTGRCAFDKTGTLTRGVFEVTSICPDVMSEDALLELAATCEHYSDHPISQSLKAAFDGEIDKSRIGRITETAGEGVCATVDGIEYFVGNETLMRRVGITTRPCGKHHHGGTVLHVAKTEEYLGHIVISDRLREDAKAAIDGLKGLGIEDITLLSGDQEENALVVGRELGIQKIHGALLPQDKFERVKALSQGQSTPTVFVGDGINDAPVLAGADVGVAMGGIGADAAMEAGDAVIIDDKVSKLVLAIRIARKTMGIVWQNVVLSIGIKLFVLIPNIFLGEESVPLFLAVFADVGVCVLAVLNAARALYIRK